MRPVQPPTNPSSETGLNLPREVPGFRLKRELGRGGMGVVYEAEEENSGRTVALKVLASELSVSEEAFSRFQREARLAGAISDVNCVFVYGAHHVEGSPAISMELVGGETLEDRLKQGEPIPIETAVRWAIEVLDGLEAAHEVGVVHRDVKPSNCFLTPDGHVKIGDFGLARTLERDVQLTQSGAFLGSPLYASPEQVRGRTLDLRSDLYSAAATLYAMLTGSAPFSGGSVGEVLARILSESPPGPRSLRPEIPRSLEKVVLKGMSREPGGRYKSYAEFREALAAFAGGKLRPAGLAQRIVAYMIDLIPLWIVETVITMGTGMSIMETERSWIVASPLVALGMYSFPMLYFGLCEGLFGATPGKWAFGQRVLPKDSGSPSLVRALARAALFSGPGYVAYLLHWAFGTTDPKLGPFIPAVASIVIFLVTFCTARRKNGWRGLHEILSGTRTTQRPSPFRLRSPMREATSTSAEPLEDGTGPVGGYEVEGVIGETPYGRMLLGRDPDLARSVWLHERAHADAPDPSKRDDRPARLHWLTSIDQEGKTYDVYEDPGGIGCSTLHARGAPPWGLARRQLRSLADELATLDEEHIAVEQVWIDRSWKIRVLDVPLGTGEAGSQPALHVMSSFASLLFGSGQGQAPLPQDLPAHAEPTLRRLLTPDQPFKDIHALREELAGWEGRPTELSPNLRAAQLALSAAFPAFGAAMAILSTIVVFLIISSIGPGAELASQLHEAQERQTEGDAEGEPPPEGELLQAYQIVIADGFGGGFSPLVTSGLDEGPRREIVETAIEAYPDPTPEEVDWAMAQLDQAGVKLPEGDSGGAEAMGMIVVVMTLFPGGLWLLFAVASSFALRGGLSFRLTGIRIRTRTGDLASRSRCLLRCLVGAAPMVMIIAAGIAALATEQVVGGAALVGLALLLALAGMAYAMLSPAGSLQDRIVGTRLVPR